MNKCGICGLEFTADVVAHYYPETCIKVLQAEVERLEKNRTGDAKHRGAIYDQLDRLEKENTGLRNQNEYLRDVNQKTCDELVGLRKRLEEAYEPNVIMTDDARKRTHDASGS